MAQGSGAWAMAAVRVMLGRLRALAATRASFAFETTLSSRTFAPWLSSLVVEAIIADVKGKHAVDAKCVFTLGWSSGGPPCYATALKEGSPVTGAFVAMSVFKPEQLPKLENGKGKAFYILHSPTDFIQMRFPEAARDQLAAAGATTKLVTYEGGHGWKGDVYGNIRAGVDWLEGEAGK